MALTFDPATRRIILDVSTVTATEIYSRWVDWVAAFDNAKYPVAFASLGGDELGGGLSVPPYYFLANDWRVRPMEVSQTLTITGNLFVSGGGDPVVPTLGLFNVLTKLVVPVQAQGISIPGSTGPTAIEIAVQVRAELSAELAKLDATVTSRMAAGAIIAVPTALQNAAAVRAALAAELTLLDVAISSRIAANSTVNANLVTVNNLSVTGAGTRVNPWRPV